MKSLRARCPDSSPVPGATPTATRDQAGAEWVMETHSTPRAPGNQPATSAAPTPQEADPRLDHRGPLAGLKPVRPRRACRRGAAGVQLTPARHDGKPAATRKSQNKVPPQTPAADGQVTRLIQYALS